MNNLIGPVIYRGKRYEIYWPIGPRDLRAAVYRDGKLIGHALDQRWGPLTSDYQVMSTICEALARGEFE